MLLLTHLLWVYSYMPHKTQFRSVAIYSALSCYQLLPPLLPSVSLLLSTHFLGGGKGWQEPFRLGSLLPLVAQQQPWPVSPPRLCPKDQVFWGTAQSGTRICARSGHLELGGPIAPQSAKICVLGHQPQWTPGRPSLHTQNPGLLSLWTSSLLPAKPPVWAAGDPSARHRLHQPGVCSVMQSGRGHTEQTPCGRITSSPADVGLTF
jgi:hypothetical protein